MSSQLYWVGNSIPPYDKIRNHLVANPIVSFIRSTIVFGNDVCARVSLVL